MEVSTTILIISILVAFAGWAKFFYDLLTSSPKISGKIFYVWIGETASPDKPPENFTTFFVYLYLINKRKNSVHILDYELEVDWGSGFERLLRFLGIQNKKEWRFKNQTHLFEIPDFNQKLIYSPSRPVEYGIPLHGWVVFASEKPKHSFFEKGGVRKYKVTAIDAFQKRHRIICSPDKFVNISLLLDIAGIKASPLGKQPNRNP